MRRAAQDGHDILEEAERFFERRSAVHDSLHRLARRLDDAGILSAVMGRMAVFAHGVRRPTDNLDVLLTQPDFAEFLRLYVPACYVLQPGKHRRTTDLANQVPVDFFLTGHHPGIDRRVPITHPDPLAVGELRDGIYYVDLHTLLTMKLAARRFMDLADVVRLLDANTLDESFADRLHPTLRADYLGCVTETRREAECAARND